MNDIEYVFEGHDLTTEVVMIQGRDYLDEKWSIPRRLCLVNKGSKFPYITIDEHESIFHYGNARLTMPNIKPWSPKTAPKHLEVELEDGDFYVALKKTEERVTFLNDGHMHYLTWDELTKYKQWDGSPCGEVVE